MVAKAAESKIRDQVKSQFGAGYELEDDCFQIQVHILYWPKWHFNIIFMQPIKMELWNVPVVQLG